MRAIQNWDNTSMRSKWTIAGILLLLIVGGWWLASGEPTYDWPVTNAPPSGSRIIAFGDSLTDGKGADRQRAYPAQLAERLGVPILNAGVSGNTTDDAMQRLKADVLAQNPDIVIICLGGNDFMRRRNIDTTFKNLREMIDKIQSQGAMVVLVGLTFPMGSAYGPRYEELARETGSAFVADILDGILGRDSLMSDAIHPNETGYGKMVDRIEPILRKHLSMETAQ